MKILKEILFNPPAAIARAKREKDITKMTRLLIGEWVLIGIAVLIILSRLGQFTALKTALAVFLVGLPSCLFFALLLKIVMVTLGGRGKYFEALASITLGNFAIASGILISSVLLFFPTFGFLLAFIVIAVSASLSIATFYRAVKELFTADIVTTWIGIGLSFVAIMVGIYLLILLYSAGIPTPLTTGRIVW